MGKRRFVSLEEINNLSDSLKKAKNPLEARPGITDRTEHLRQIFQCNLKQNSKNFFLNENLVMGLE
jgi:hypothetical protein